MASEETQLAASLNKFSVNIYNKLRLDNSGDNVFVSPFSIYTALSMTYAGARTETESEMAEVLFFKELKSLHDSFKSYLQSMASLCGAGVALKTANKMLVKENFPLLEEFKGICQKHYSSETEVSDFADAASVCKNINDWVEGKTNGKIKDLLSESLINGLTRLILVNAIYFKGDWKFKFKNNATRKEKFRMIGGQTVDVDMMHQSEKFDFGTSEELQCHLLEMPYVGDQLSMIALLPYENEGLLAMEDKLSSVNLQSLFSKMHNMKTVVSFPKFKLEFASELKKPLSALGMPTAFDAHRSDFSGIESSKSLFVSAVVHKAFIEVNEEGTEAAAATAVIMQMRCMPMLNEFKADHPFLYIIREKKSGGILFMGRYFKPE